MNGHAGINTLEATEHLKNILNVGKSETEAGKLKAISNGNMEAAGDSNLVLNNPLYQKIELSADKESSDHSIYGNEVDIYSSPLIYGAACSQIIVNHMVDFGWEEKYYYGRLISFHLGGRYLAYVLKPANNKPGYVRVLRVRSDWRYLIKDFKHEVKDIAFAHSTSRVLLGSIDACGEVLVHKISEDDNSLICELLLRILRPTSWLPSEHNHIIWCLYIPDDNEDETIELEKTSLLVVTHEEKAEIWNIHNVMENHGQGSISFDEASVGVQSVSEFEKPINTATFSPDGSALAIGSLDGVVKFFQVNIIDKNNSPRCLHHWTPHGDKTLSSLYFLDNHKNCRPDVQFWKFAITGADNNTELKVWCCETWVCFQTIRIHSNPDDCVQPCLKAEMDLTSNYLILSDIRRKVLLILLVQQDPLSNTAFIKSVSEFRVRLPVLNLTISSVSFVKLSSISGGEHSDDEEGEQIGDSAGDNDENRNKLIVKLFWIQTKTLQSCRITYRPKLESPLHSIGSVSSLSQDSYGFKDRLSDISLDAKESSNLSSQDLEMSLPKGLCIDKLAVSSQSSTSNITSLASHMNYSNCTEVLLTPDDFTSPSHSNLSAQSAYAHHEEAKNPVSSKCDSATRLSDGIDSLPVEPSTLQRRKSSQHSATSSPSREVAEIMAPTKGLLLDEIVLETPNLKVKDHVESLSNSLSSFAVSATPITSRNQLDYHMKEWPEAPNPNEEYRVSSKNEKDINNHNKYHLPSKETAPSVQFEAESNQVSHRIIETLEKMSTQIEELRNLANSQNHVVQNLQTEIKSLQDQKQSQINTLISSKLDQVLSQHVLPGYSRIENLILKTSEEEQRQTERGLAVMSNDVSATFANRLDNTLKQELASCILPQINRVLDTIAQKMQLDFSQKLGATDINLRETFNKHLKGKTFVESLAQHISTSLQDIIHSACKEVFQSTVPAFEKSCQNLFHQLNELFQRGTLDYIQILVEKNGATSCNILESTASQIKEEIHNLAASTQQAIYNQVENHNLELKKQQETLFSNMRQIIFEEVRKAVNLKSQASAANSQSATPVPYNDRVMEKTMMLHLVKIGNMDEAFKLALSSMDVQIVLYLCENANIDQVFGASRPMQQPVLLSLVNQLSVDLTVKTDIKVRYIEEAIACLDSSDPVIKDHIRNVLDILQQRIINFQKTNPSHKLSRNMKRISLAIQSLVQN